MNELINDVCIIWRRVGLACTDNFDACTEIMQSVNVTEETSRRNNENADPKKGNHDMKLSSKHAIIHLHIKLRQPSRNTE